VKEKMDDTSKYDIPWELITDSFTGILSPADERILNEWVSSTPANTTKYLKLKELWEKGLDDYRFYKEADESTGWKNLSARMNSDQTILPESLFKIKKNHFIRNFSGIAASITILIAVGYLVLFNNKNIYKTAYDEQKQVKLKDGTEVFLKPQTTIRIASDFNESERIISMDEGEASFEVMHRDNPFIIKAGPVRIQDLGTNFTVRKDKEKIYVEVKSGKVAFIVNETNETKELTAGMNVTFGIYDKKLGDIIDTKTGQISQQMLLNFDNVPLSEVIYTVHKIYGNKIGIADSTIGKKRLTADFNGVSFENIIAIICKSLDLQCPVKDSTYLFIEK
jgi:transmembrane sensor